MQDKHFIAKRLQQNTSAWKEWRNGGIGGSDAPIVMQESPWTSREELLLMKAGMRRERPATAAMQRGKYLEEEARDNYIEEVGIHVSPICVESCEYPWLRASLDGMSPDGDHLVEIKCPGARDHETAENGNVPRKYYPQLQHFLAITGLDEIDYWSYRDGEGCLITVIRDDDYIQELIKEEQKFWNEVIALREKKKERPEQFESELAKSKKYLSSEPKTGCLLLIVLSFLILYACFYY